MTTTGQDLVETLTHELLHAQHQEEAQLATFIAGDIFMCNYEICGATRVRSSYDGTDGEKGIGLTYRAAEEIDGIPSGAGGTGATKRIPGGLLTKIEAAGDIHHTDLQKALKSISNYHERSTTVENFLVKYVYSQNGIDAWVLH